MAKTSYIDILPEIEDQFWSAIQPGDRFTFARVARKNLLLSRKRKKGVSQRSLLPEISEAWASLSDAERQDWSTVAAYSNLNGWRLFVQDYCARRANDLPGLAVPNVFHQSWVGQIHVEAPATEAKITQIHPRSYYIKKKVFGAKGMYSPVLVTEDLALPFYLELCYFCDLVPAGPDPYIKVSARFWYSYQGQNLFQDLELNLIPYDYWSYDFAELTELISYVVRYDLYIHVHDLQGDFFFDNIIAQHSGQNWARDPFCKDIDQSFTRNFYQIPKHWAPVILPEGADFESVYRDFD